MGERMAAVFALVFLFVLASLGLLGKVVIGDPSVMSIFAFATFMALATGSVRRLFQARAWLGGAGRALT